MILVGVGSSTLGLGEFAFWRGHEGFHWGVAQHHYCSAAFTSILVAPLLPGTCWPLLPVRDSDHFTWRLLLSRCPSGGVWR